MYNRIIKIKYVYFFIAAGHELVMINFYADWCRFSNILRPVYDEAADAVAKEFPDGKAILAKVDCDQQPALQSKYKIYLIVIL